MCIRDYKDLFVLSKTEWMSLLLDVDLRETFDILSALWWMCDHQLFNVDFEMDSKVMIDGIYGSRFNFSNFGSVIHDFQRLLYSNFATSDVMFIRWQASEIVHGLTRITHVMLVSIFFFEFYHVSLLLF